VFSAEQADRGHAAYTQRCAMCHGERLDDGDFGGAPLRGAWFRDHWGTGSVAALFTYVQTQMPPDNPGGLNDTTYADILAFLLQRNGYAAGAAELPPNAGAMEKMSLQK
jgi:mono/diheme cytochrome c family protein